MNELMTKVFVEQPLALPRSVNNTVSHSKVVVDIAQCSANKTVQCGREFVDRQDCTIVFNIDSYILLVTPGDTMVTGVWGLIKHNNI